MPSASDSDEREGKEPAESPQAGLTPEEASRENADVEDAFVATEEPEAASSPAPEESGKEAVADVIQGERGSPDLSVGDGAEKGVGSASVDVEGTESKEHDLPEGKPVEETVPDLPVEGASNAESGLSAAAAAKEAETATVPNPPVPKSRDSRSGSGRVSPIRRGVAIFCSVLGLTAFLLSTVLTYQVAVPGIQHIFFSSLVISNLTMGFHTSEHEVLPGLYKSWYFWNITNQGNYVNGTEPPQLQQVGPYTMQQVVKTYAVNFSRQEDEVLRSTVVYGIYSPEKSCDTCALSDRVTVVNEVFIATLGLYDSDDTELLRTYVPGIITDALQHIEAYLVKKGKTPAAASALALQQFRDCTPLGGKSIQKLDPTYQFQKYAPEYCAWAKNENIKYSPRTMNATEFSFLMSVIFSGKPDAVSTVVKGINPETGFFKSLGWLSYQLSVGILEYLNYLTNNPAKQMFTLAVSSKNGGLIMTRSVEELLYGYFDPWLEYLYGNRSNAAWVAQIHTQQEVETPSRPFPEAKGAMGINTGRNDISKLYWVTQQGTTMKNTPVALNAREIQWDHGTVKVEAPSGLFFGPLKVQRGQNVSMWLDNWMRHVTLQYTGVGHVHGLAIYKYTMADVSLSSCNEPPRKLQTEGPCMYPNTYRGLINMSRFQTGVFQTLPHFYRVDPRLVTTLGSKAGAMKPEQLYEFTMDVEPFFGATVNLSFWFQKVFQIKRLTLLYPTIWINASHKTFPSSVWLPHSFYQIQASANKSVCDALAAGSSTLSAAVFLMRNVVPFFSVGCLICGLQCLWRRKKLTLCFIVCVEGDPDDAEPLELMTALVMDSEVLSKLMEQRAREEENQKAELSRRCCIERVAEHSLRHDQLKRQYANHQQALIEQAAMEEAAREQGVMDGKGAEQETEQGFGDTEVIGLGSGDSGARGTAASSDVSRTVSLLVPGGTDEQMEKWLAEQMKDWEDYQGEAWPTSASQMEAEEEQQLSEGGEGEIAATSPIQAWEATGTESETQAELTNNWSRTASLIEATVSHTKACLEWSRMASPIEARDANSLANIEWSRTTSLIGDVERSRPSSSAEAPEGSNDWSRTASLIETEDISLRRFFTRTARLPSSLTSADGFSEKLPTSEREKEEKPEQGQPRQEGGEPKMNKRVTFFDGEVGDGT